MVEHSEELADFQREVIEDLWFFDKSRVLSKNEIYFLGKKIAVIV